MYVSIGNERANAAERWYVIAIAPALVGASKNQDSHSAAVPTQWTGGEPPRAPAG